MSVIVRFSVQTFERDRRGRLKKSRLINCPSAEEARRYAERSVRTAHAVGAAAFSQKGNGEFDDSNEPVTFAAFGCVPPEMRDELPF